MTQTSLDCDSHAAVLLVNLGTPDAPTPPEVRRYLAEFLWDPRVVEIPRWVWWLALHGVILRIRPRKAARAYASIWTERGSPLLALTESLSEAVRAELHAKGLDHVAVTTAMRYGRPSIRERLEMLRAAGVTNLLVLPLYPQYAAATTASIFDAVADTLRSWRRLPKITFVNEYHRDDGYVHAVSESIADFWRESGTPSLLLFSFHGLPERCRALGDPYYDQCLETAKLIANRLGLEDSKWRVVFQSRFGPAQWIKPYCVEVLRSLPADGIKDVDLVCPGFAVDCLETLEEIAVTNREIFLQAGGERYRYIPALNDRPAHARAIATLIERQFATR